MRHATTAEGRTCSDEKAELASNRAMEPSYPLASKMDLEYHAKAGIFPDALVGGH
jgi:hypothetical protein